MANPKPQMPAGLPARKSVAGEGATTTRTPAFPRRRRKDGMADAAPWTASRCLRILRRLESRLALLRKLVDTPKDVHVQRTRSTTSAESTAKRSNLRNDDGEQNERRKRPRHTYGGRSKKRKSSTKSPPSASPTRQTRSLRDMKPRLSSTRTDQEALTTPPYANQHIYARDIACLTPLYHAHEAVEEDKDRICEWICRWLTNFLWDTNTTVGELHPKSLLGMCLRKIPACIDEIDAWDKAMAQDEAPNSIRQTPGAALDIYSQLEAFGAAGLGWRPLKQTLRAHGLWMLKKAIEENIFNPSQAAMLVECCMGGGCLAEATQLVLRPNGPYPLAPSESSPMRGEPTLEPLRALLLFRTHKNLPRGPVFDLVCNMIKEKQPPVAWLCTRHAYELLDLLHAAIEAIGKDKGSTAAFGLITEVISALCTVSVQENCWHNSDTIDRNLSTILEKLVALSGPGTCKGDKFAETRASFALDCCINRISTQEGFASGETLFILSLARFLVGDGSLSNEGQNAHETFLELRATDGEQYGASTLSSRHYNIAMHFVCDVSESCSARFREPAHKTLFALLLKIERLPWPGWVLKGLQKDGPFVLAQATGDLRDLAFAESQQAVKMDSSPSKQSGTMFSDWYWDETIGEFVERSPQKEEGGSPNTPQSRLQSPTRHCARQAPQLSQTSPMINEGAADAVHGSDDGVDLRSGSEIAEENGSTELMNKRSRRTSNKFETSEDFEKGATQGTAIKGRQWKPAADKGYPMSKRAARLGFGSDASPAPIGGARQLFIVRGPGRRNVGEDHDWLNW